MVQSFYASRTDSSAMTTDTVEKRFSSKNPTVDYNASISLSFSAYFDEDSYIDKNTLIFDCDPIGNNYDRTYLQVKIDDWTSITRIREFLSHHFVDMEDTRRTLTVPVEEGEYALTPVSGEGQKSEDFDEIQIIAEGTRIDFGGPGSMTPYIHTYSNH